MSLNVGSTIPPGQYGEGRNAMGSKSRTWENRGKWKSGKSGKVGKIGKEKAESGIKDGRPGSPRLIAQNESLGR